MSRSLGRILTYSESLGALMNLSSELIDLVWGLLVNRGVAGLATLHDGRPLSVTDAHDALSTPTGYRYDHRVRLRGLQIHAF